MFYKPDLVFVHAASVGVSALLLLVAYRAPFVARILYAVLFATACVVNLRTALVTPHVYLDYAPLAIVEVYREFILGFFARHVLLIVGTIAVCQGLIALGLVFGGPWALLALSGATLFLIDIAPLGVGAGFPSTLLMAGGTALLLHSSRRLALRRPLFTHGAAKGGPSSAHVT